MPFADSKTKTKTKREIYPYQNRGKSRLGVMKVLIVEDNKALIWLLKEVLENEGIHYVKTAENGNEGYSVFLSFKPDIILTDIEMPLKNGLEMIRNIRKLQPFIRTIYMSADPAKYKSLLNEEMAIYKADFVNKPFSVSKIMELISEG